MDAIIFQKYRILDPHQSLHLLSPALTESSGHWGSAPRSGWLAMQVGMEVPAGAMSGAWVVRHQLICSYDQLGCPFALLHSGFLGPVHGCFAPGWNKFAEGLEGNRFGLWMIIQNNIAKSWSPPANSPYHNDVHHQGQQDNHYRQHNSRAPEPANDRLDTLRQSFVPTCLNRQVRPCATNNNINGPHPPKFSDPSTVCVNRPCAADRGNHSGNSSSRK